MAWKTAGGLAASAVGASGFVEFASGAPLLAASLNSDLVGAQDGAAYALACGVIGAFDPTAAGLAVTIPSGSAYFARQVWVADGAAVVNVADGATTWLWGCADGVVRQTLTSAYPTGQTALTCCLLAVVVSAAGVAVVDVSAQQLARSAGGSGPAWDNGGAWAPAPDVIAGVAAVPVGCQIALMDRLTVTGRCRVIGKLRVV